MDRLGQNHGSYNGERIDIASVLQDCVKAAQARDWLVETLPVTLGHPHLALRRASTPARGNVYLSAGIHGDEPAGPLAAVRLLRENLWPPEIALWLCPCLNPAGFQLNRRENGQGVDLNRDYKHLATDEVRAHVEWLRRQPAFDLAICLHEDWEAHGFYLYELNPDGAPSSAEVMIEAVRRVCPIDPSPIIDGREAHGGIIRPQLDPGTRPQWPEAFFLLQTRTRHSYTIEAPSDFRLATRVTALVTAVQAALAHWTQAGRAGEFSEVSVARGS